MAAWSVSSSRKSCANRVGQQPIGREQTAADRGRALHQLECSAFELPKVAAERLQRHFWPSKAFEPPSPCSLLRSEVGGCGEPVRRHPPDNIDDFPLAGAVSVGGIWSPNSAGCAALRPTQPTVRRSFGRRPELFRRMPRLPYFAIRSRMIWLARKVMTRRGAIGTSIPVLGLRPIRCPLSRKMNVPNPETFTF